MEKFDNKYRTERRRISSDRIEFNVKKGMADQLKEIAKKKGHRSLAAYIKHLIEMDNRFKL